MTQSIDKTFELYERDCAIKEIAEQLTAVVARLCPSEPYM